MEPPIPGRDSNSDSDESGTDHVDKLFLKLLQADAESLQLIGCFAHLVGQVFPVKACLNDIRNCKHAYQYYYNIKAGESWY